MQSSNCTVLDEEAERDLDKKIALRTEFCFLLCYLTDFGLRSIVQRDMKWTCIIGGVFEEGRVSVVKIPNINCVTLDVCKSWFPLRQMVS